MNSMSSAVATWTDILRAALTEITVEQYWRMEPPSGPTVYVEPSAESSESGYSIGPHWSSDVTVNAIVEVAWDDTVSTAETMDAIVESIKAAIAANREVLSPLISTHGMIQWAFAQRPGSGVLVRVATVPIENKFPVRG